MTTYLSKIKDYYNNRYNEHNNEQQNKLNDYVKNSNLKDLDLTKNLDVTNEKLNTSISKGTSPIYDPETSGGLQKPTEEPKNLVTTPVNVKNSKVYDKNSKVDDKVNDKVNDKVDDTITKPNNNKNFSLNVSNVDDLGNTLKDNPLNLTEENKNSLPDKTKPTIKSKILHKLGRIGMGALKGAAYSMANMQDTGKMVGNIYVPAHSLGEGGLNAVRQDVQNENSNKQNQERLDIAKQKLESDSVNNLNDNIAKAKQQEITNKINQQNADTQRSYAEAKAYDLKNTIQKENKQEFENKERLFNSNNEVEVNTDQQKQFIENMITAKGLYGAGTPEDLYRKFNELTGGEKNQALYNVKTIIRGLVANNIRQSDIGESGVLSKEDAELYEKSLNDPEASFEQNIGSYNNYAKLFNGRMQTNAKLAGLTDEEMKNLRQLPVLNLDDIILELKEKK